MMLEVPEVSKDDSPFIDIRVQNPTKEMGSYISYEIIIETNDSSFSYTKSSTRRRYSDFRALSKLLSKQFPHNKLPAFPPKDIFKNTFDKEFIQKRQEALQDFLTKLVKDRMFLSSKALHLFLQSSFTIGQIKDIIDGKIPAEIQSTLSTFYDGLSSTSELGSSKSVSLESSSNSCAVLKPSSETNLNPSSDTKRVSFSDQVTVAEVHIT